MNKIKQALKSRTVWAGVALFLISGIDGVRDMLPSGLVSVVEPVLLAMIAYFKVNPSQDYKA